MALGRPGEAVENLEGLCQEKLALLRQHWPNSVGRVEKLCSGLGRGCGLAEIIKAITLTPRELHEAAHGTFASKDVVIERVFSDLHELTVRSWVKAGAVSAVGSSVAPEVDVTSMGTRGKIRRAFVNAPQADDGTSSRGHNEVAVPVSDVKAQGTAEGKLVLSSLKAT